MRRWTGWILVVLALALALSSAVAWRERRPGPAAGVGEATLALPSAPRGQATAAAPAQPVSTARAVGNASAVAPTEGRCLSALRRLVRQRSAQLAGVADADAQFAAALLDIDPPATGDAANDSASARRHRHLAWALELAPGDPVLAAQAHRFCLRDERCDGSR